MEGVSFNWVNEVGGWVKREKVAKTGVDERKGAKSGGQNEVGIEQESTKAELSKTKTGKKEAAGKQKKGSWRVETTCQIMHLTGTGEEPTSGLHSGVVPRPGGLPDEARHGGEVVEQIGEEDQCGHPGETIDG
jgi:hypothetical protein